jgi:hypothetical protein
LDPEHTDSAETIFTHLLGPLDITFDLNFGSSLDRFIDENTVPAVAHLLRPFIHEFPDTEMNKFVKSTFVSNRNPDLWCESEQSPRYFTEIPVPRLDAHQHPYAEYKMTRDTPTLVICRPKYIPHQLPTIACLHAPKFAEHVAAARSIPSYVFSAESTLSLSVQGERMKNLRPHQYPISAVAMSDCGKFVLSCDILGHVVVQRTDGMAFHEYQTSRLLITACAFSPTIPHQFVVGSMPGSLILYATGRTEIQRVFCAHVAGIVTVLIHPNSEFVGSASCDGTVRLWSISLGCCVRLFKAAGPVPTCLRFSHSGKWIMTTANDGNVTILDAGTGKAVKSFKASDTVIMSADFSLSDELVIGYDRMGNFFVWETNDAYGCQLATVRIDRVRVVAFDCLANDEIRIVGCSKQ